MAKEIYPFAEIIQGDFAGMYVYWCKLYQNYHIRSGSVFKEGLLSLDVWGNSAYTYDFGDIIGYEEIGSAAHSANAGSVLMGGFLFGTVGAIAASAAGSGTTHDTVIYFKDGKQCVFRFLNGTSHQNYITGFHQRGIKPGDPFAVTPKVEKIESGPTKPALDPKELLEFADDIDENAEYDLYACIQLPVDFLLPSEVDDTVQYLRKYTDDISRVRQDVKDGEEFVLLRRSVSSHKTKRFLDDLDCYDHNVTLKARLKEKTEATVNEQRGTSAANYEELKQLKELLDLGIISQEEFDAKKKQILGL